MKLPFLIKYLKNHRVLVLIWLQFSSILMAGRHVVINQVGYRPDSEKFVFTTQYSDSFNVVDYETGKCLFNGYFEQWKSNDPSTDLNIYRGDFTDFKKPGIYYILTTSSDSSYIFQIDDSVYYDSFLGALKVYYLQRCGKKLASEFAGEYARQQCHIADGFFHSSADTSGFNYSIGGWHDAGDYGKYLVNAGVTVGTLLMAYEFFPDYFNMDDLSIPESNNNIPDILDEVQYELYWLLSMQSLNGGVFHKLTTEQFAPFIMPNKDLKTRYIYQISTTATADFSAVMAKASRIYQAYDLLFSQRCLTSAEKAWEFLEKHPQMVPQNGFRNPSGTNTGEYGDYQDLDERVWAAVELFLTTGESKYHDYFKNNYEQLGLISEPMSWQNVAPMAYLPYLIETGNNIDQIIQNRLINSLQDYCNSLVNIGNGNGFQMLLNPGEYCWGSNSHLLNKTILLIVGYQITQDKRFLNVALNQLHYIFGVNAHAMSFVTGIGSNTPMFPHHAPSAADGIQDPIPGMLVGGPNEYLQDPVLVSYFSGSTPPALCYIDHEGSYASNEIAINWNAPLVFVIGYLGQVPLAETTDQNSCTVPNQIQLYQNFPNPFNNGTAITFKLQTEEKIILKIYSIIGTNVCEKDIGNMAAGENIVEWDGINRYGDKLSSGIYLCKLYGKESSNTIKLVILQ